MSLLSHMPRQALHTATLTLAASLSVSVTPSSSADVDTRGLALASLQPPLLGSSS